MKNDIEWNEIDLEQGENNTSVKIDINHQNEANGDQGEINDKGEDGEDELYDKEIIEKAFENILEKFLFSTRRSHQKIKMTIKRSN